MLGRWEKQVLIKTHRCDGFSIASLYEFIKRYGEAKLAQQQRRKTEYNIKIADLSYASISALNKTLKKKISEILNNRQFSNAYELYITIDMSIKEAIYKRFKTLKDLREIFRTNEDCIKFLEDIIWRGEPVSPYDITSKVYKCKDGWYKCKNTGKEFNILTGTLFQGTKIDLPTWFEIIFCEHADKGGIAATTIMRKYGYSYSTAWHMLQKIRNAMGKENHEKTSGVVETDEYHSGGLMKNKHYDKKLEAKKMPNQGKKLLQGFVERNGNAVIRTIPDATEGTLIAGILRYVEKGSTLYSDDNPSYGKLPRIYKRGSVIHSKGNYVNKKNKIIHTNTMESLWASHRRTENTYIKISQKHHQNYANETVFRYNTRKLKNSGDACTWFLQNIKDTKITWKEIRDAKYTMYNRNKERAA